MNFVCMMGRLTRDPEVRYAQSQNGEQIAIARFSLAVNRKVAKNAAADTQTADFINCIAFGKRGEFAEKYLKKGIKIAITGHIQTGNFTNKDGVKIYTTDIIVNSCEFAESKGSSSSGFGTETQSDEFVPIPEGIEGDLPFN